MVVRRCEIQPAGGVSTIKLAETVSAEEAEAMLKRYALSQILCPWNSTSLHIQPGVTHLWHRVVVLFVE